MLAACKGSGGPTEALDQLLKLDEALETGHAQSWALKEQPVEYLLAFRALAEVGCVDACNRTRVFWVEGMSPPSRFWTVSAVLGLSSGIRADRGAAVLLRTLSAGEAGTLQPQQLAHAPVCDRNGLLCKLSWWVAPSDRCLAGVWGAQFGT